MRLVTVLVLVCGLVGMIVAGPGVPTVRAERMVHVGIGGGLSVPVGDAGDAVKSGFHAQGYLSFTPPMLPLGIRAALNLHHFSYKEALEPGEVSRSGNVLGGMANATFRLIKLGPIRPYLTAGLGAFQVKTDSASTSNSETRFGLNAGAGVQFKLSSITAFAEARFNNIYTDRGFNNPVAGTTAATKIVPITFGVQLF